MKIHFIGIGGIGVSALAKYHLVQGHKVSGSDLVCSEITEALKKLGAKIYIGSHQAQNVKMNHTNLVIYSPAVGADNLELKTAKKLGIKCQSYPEALGELTKKYFTIAVSGTHGKSTTTAMIGLLLKKAGLDPTVIVGTKVREFRDSNCQIGKSNYLVIEADEYMASFLNYWPKIIVLTNIERDHLDYYKNLNNILKTYKQYINHLPKNGILIANGDDQNIKKITLQKYKSVNDLKKVAYYSLKQREAEKLKRILKVPGEYNVLNGLAALSTARVLKIPDMISFKALSEYKGSWRRFQIIEADKLRYLGQFRPKIILISDYGHHPTEIKVTLKAAQQKYPQKEMWCVFQPHQYQRTYYLFDDFVKVFREAPIDRLIITDIYDVKGREEKEIKEKTNSERLVKSLKKSLDKNMGLPNQKFLAENIIYLANIEKIKNYLKNNLKGGEVVIIIGAGDIYNLTLDLTKVEEKKKIK